MERIYLDHAATSPLVPGVREAMEPWIAREFGNASSLYEEGRKAKDAIDQAREVVSNALECEFGEITFTSSGTEAANLAILGLALANRGNLRNRILLGAAEHHCVIETRELLESFGYEVELIPVDSEAKVQLNWLNEHLDDRVLLVSVQSANNETGTIQPIREIASLCKRFGAIFHCDAVQSFGSRKENEEFIVADLVSISAHKIGGPKGIGALFFRAGIKLTPLQIGGGQERELRAGTENVAGIVGFGTAVKAMPYDTERSSRKAQARNAFADLLESDSNWLPTVKNRCDVLPGHCHGRFRATSAESMLIRLDGMGVSASSGAACSSGSILPSHVMKACGYSEQEAKEALRFTFGWNSTVEDAKEAAHRVLEAVSAVRSSSTR
jgi:cysteine desulfurase